MAYFAGVDVGWIYAKAVILNEKAIASRQMVLSRGNYDNVGNDVLTKALEEAGISLDEVVGVAMTGHRAANVPKAKEKVSEIVCTSRGVFHQVPSARTIIEVSGQSQKVITINEEGKPVDFFENQRCATGTYNCEICGAASNRYLHQVAVVLDVKEEDLGELSLKATSPVKYDTSACAVAARSEVRTWLANGASKEDIIAGVHAAAAVRIAAMLTRSGVHKDVVVTGGGAKDAGLIKAIEERLGTKVLIPEHPEYSGALGAVLVARDAAQVAQVKDEKSEEERQREITRLREERRRERERLINETIERERKMRRALW